MKKMYKFLKFNILCVLCLGTAILSAQATLRGKVVDAESGEELIGAAVVIMGTTGGAVTDYEGVFTVKVEKLPVTLKVSYTGYTAQEINVTDPAQKLDVRLSTSSIVITEAVVRGQRIDDKQKAAPLTVENLDAIAIKQTAAVSFYNGLGNLKGVDLTTASLGFTVINMRGFNSTSPVRSLQIIDGVDNQAPGLNFSLGNFLGCSELDVNKVDLIVGASSAFYGPNAFNGVISMESKNPFINRGLAVSLKTGERNLLEGAFRYADAIKNKSGHPFMAYKLNFFGLRANDWVADNYNPITEAEGNQVFTSSQNPGGWNAVNIYGDEYSGRFVSTYDARAGLNSFHRQGYKEEDIVDYNTKNAKAGIALHFRLNPAKEFESPELILASNYGTGTTVYQGDNRFSLRGIQFYQNRLELRQKDKFFLRFYATNEDAGKSYDPYFTALKLQEAAKTNEKWQQAYEFWWVRNDLGAVFKKMKDAGYGPPDNYEALLQWQRDNAATLAQYHQQAQAYANEADHPSDSGAFYEPGTVRFDSLFNAIVSRKNNSRENGTLFYDKSALYHAHGEYHFKPRFLNDWVVGASMRMYRPNSDGTIFIDSLGSRIKNSEWGAYTGAEKQVGDFKFSATVRVDKNQNFDYLATPAASIVWTPKENNYLRVSFSSAIRNPTLTDQYLNLNVGPATLIGNLNGFDSLITLESFQAYRDDNSKPLVYQNVAPIQPEKVKTFELGYRTTLFKRIYVDAGYYYNIYDDFIGYNIGLTLPFEKVLVFPPDIYTYFPDFDNLKVYRVAANASQRVTSQGFAIGLNYYFLDYFMLQGNYSWNKLITDSSDPIVPAFNTPEHKFNIGFSGRDITAWGKNTLGFTVNYKWIDNFTFEGSPQFTGLIPSYDLLDAQVNLTMPKIHSTIKLGASNVLNNKQFQTYGGPRIGRMAYLSLLYDFREK
ncbi:MAG: TonB-dependent receptor [Saprospiraceae bacterium]|nr:TonB-dependent receptor [Saprospiraceae bacterium]